MHMYTNTYSTAQEQRKSEAALTLHIKKKKKKIGKSGTKSLDSSELRHSDKTLHSLHGGQRRIEHLHDVT